MRDTFYNNRRRARRQSLVYYLKVIDLATGKELGRIADITSDGMLLFGNKVLNKKKTYHVRIIMEKNIFDIQHGNIDVNAQIRWSKPDANPELTLTGMLFLDLTDKDRKIVGSIIKTIGMSGNLDFIEEDIENGVFDEEVF